MYQEQSSSETSLAVIQNPPYRRWAATVGIALVLSLFSAFAAEPQELHTQQSFHAPVLAVAYDPNGVYVAVGLDDVGDAPTSVVLWDQTSGQNHPLEGHQGPVYSVAFSPDGRYLASGSDDTTIRLWNLATGDVDILRGHQDVVRSVAFSPDGRYLASGSEDATGRLWDLVTGEVAFLPGHQGSVISVAFDPGGRFLASGSEDNTIGLWDLFTGDVVALLGHEDWVRSVAFSPDGTSLASGSDDGTVRLWSLFTGNVIALFEHEDWVRSIAFSPDGQHLASGSDDGIVRLWNLFTRDFVALLGHEGWVRSVAFNSDGKLLASGSDDQTAVLWALEPLPPDNIPPTAQIDSARTTVRVNEMVMFSASDSSDTDGFIARYDWDFGNGDTDQGMLASYHFRSAGDYTVTVTVTDNDGATATASMTIRVEASANASPVADARTFDTEFEVGIPISFNASSSFDKDGSIVKNEWDFGDGTTAEGRNVTHAFANDGVYDVTLTVTDDDGATDTDILTIQVGTPVITNTPPRFTQIGTIPANAQQRLLFVLDEGTQGSLTFVGMDPDGDSLSYGAFPLPPGGQLQGNTFVWTPAHSLVSRTEDTQDFDLTLTVSDGQAEAQQPIRIRVQHVSDAATISMSAEEDILPAIGDVVTQLIIQVQNAQGAPVTDEVITVELLPGPISSGGTITVLDDEDGDLDGIYIATYTAGRQLGVDRITATTTNGRQAEVSITLVPGPPALLELNVSPTTLAAGSGQSAQIDVHVTDIADHPVPDIPVDLAILPGQAGTLSAVTQEGEGHYTATFTVGNTAGFVTLTATAGQAEEQTTITLTETVANRPPELQGDFSGRQIEEGVNFTFQVSATDPEDDDVTLSVGTLPSGATFDKATGRLSWRPGFNQAGDYRVTFTASDPDGAKDNRTLNIQVDDVNRDPQIANITSPRNLTVGERHTFSIGISDPDSDNTLTLEYRPTVAGANLVRLGSTSYRFEWTPTTAQAGSHNLTFTVSDGRGGTDSSGSIRFNVGVRDTEPPEATVALALTGNVKTIGGKLYSSATRITILLSDVSDDHTTDHSNLKLELRNSGGTWVTRAFTDEPTWDVTGSDGSKTVQIRLSDEAGNTSAPLQVAFILDRKAPEIDHTPITSGDPGTAFPIEMSVTDISPITGRLYYRSAGEYEYQERTMTGAAQLSAEIPATASAYGVTYYLEAQDALGHTSTFPEQGEETPLGVTVSGEFTQTAPFPAQAWHLFSTPISVSPTDLTSILNGVLGQGNWAAEDWDGDNTVRATPHAVVGRPFWLITREQTRLTLEGTTSDTAEPHAIAMHKGWNLVSNPFPFPVAFGSLRVGKGKAAVPLDEASSVRPRFWSWRDNTSDDKTNGVYETLEAPGEEWEPWSGYWMFADADATLQVLPFADYVEGLAAPMPMSFRWLGDLTLVGPQSTSTAQLALAADAQWGYDRLDSEQPPVPAETVLSLLQEGMAFQRVAFPAEASEWVWEARISAKEDSVLILSDDLPVGYRFYYESVRDGLRTEVIPGLEITVPKGDSLARLRLTQTSHGWDIADMMPAETRLLANYPNPFNPETWIPFLLAEPANVDLRIYDSHGLLVRTFALGQVEPGRYSQPGRAVYWDGKNQAAEGVASGIYFVRFRAGEYQQVKRILLLK